MALFKDILAPVLVTIVADAISEHFVKKARGKWIVRVIFGGLAIGIVASAISSGTDNDATTSNSQTIYNFNPTCDSHDIIGSQNRSDGTPSKTVLPSARSRRDALEANAQRDDGPDRPQDRRRRDQETGNGASVDTTQKPSALPSVVAKPLIASHDETTPRAENSEEFSETSDKTGDAPAQQAPSSNAPTLPRGQLHRMSAGDFHVCAITGDGSGWCWGSNGGGQLGNDSARPSSAVPTKVVGAGSSLTEISAARSHGNSGAHTCAITTEGAALCWGNNRGRLGDGGSQDSRVPKAVVGLSRDTTSISVGSLHTCATKRDGSAWCWGDNKSGQLGDNSTVARSIPVQVHDLDGAIQTASGRSHSCALKADGSVWCWGSNTEGQLGTGTNDGSPTAVQVTALDQVTAIVAGDVHTCASKRDGTVWCWGGNTDGQLGNDSTISSSSPVRVKNLKNVSRLSSADVHTCALEKQRVWCWGANTQRKLGSATSTRSFVPVNVEELSKVVEIASGPGYDCARKNDDSLWCWGDGGMGRLGDGKTRATVVPIGLGALGQ